MQIPVELLLEYPGRRTGARPLLGNRSRRCPKSTVMNNWQDPLSLPRSAFQANKLQANEMFAPRLACFWPGLAAAWHRGLTRGLAVALVYSWTICLLLLATFVWPEWLATGFVRSLWLGAFVVWCVESARSSWRMASLLETSSVDSDEAFATAQEQYLRGNWFEAEALLLEIVHQHPRDAEATMLLVGVLRHTQRWQAALRRLAQMELQEASASWRFEIARERHLIEREMAESQALSEASGDGAETSVKLDASVAEHESKVEFTEPVSTEPASHAQVSSDNSTSSIGDAASDLVDDSVHDLRRQVGPGPLD